MSWTNEDLAFLKDLVNKGNLVLVADTSLGIPTIHGIPNARHLGFGYFEAVNPEYTIEFEGGGAMRRTPSGKGYCCALVTRGEYPYDYQDVVRKLGGDA